MPHASPPIRASRTALFQHVDVTAGLHAAGAPDEAACLSFALGSVQPFIEAARSVRDLWFVAVVPWGEGGGAAAALREACIGAARTGWRLADAVRDRLDPKFAPHCRDWARSWDSQIDGALDFRAAAAPLNQLDDDRLARLVEKTGFASAWPDAQAIRLLEKAIPDGHRPGYRQDHAGRWQAPMEMSVRLLAAPRAVRHVPRGRSRPRAFAAEVHAVRKLGADGPRRIGRVEGLPRRASSPGRRRCTHPQ